MKKIVPILLIILAAFFVLVGGAGFTTICVAAKAMPEMSVIAVPFILMAFCGSAVVTALSVYLKKSLLCRISAIIGGVGVLLSVVGIIIWLVIM